MSDNPLNYLPSPDPRVVRKMMAGRAKAGEVRNTGCSHPTSAIFQFMDELPDRHRNQRPTNLFECSICRSLLRLVDWNGNEAVDG